MAEYFNPEPILLGNPASLIVGKANSSNKPMVFEIAQHLEPEQYLYEFPPKSLILDDEDSFFDEYSIASNSTAVYSNINIDDEQEEQELSDDLSYIVADNQLSPLQLPTQVNDDKYRQDSNGTITLSKSFQRYTRPSSFLSTCSFVLDNKINWDERSFVFPDYQQKVYHQSIHPFSRRNSLEDDLISLNDHSHCSNNSKVIFMKLNKTSKKPTFIHFSQTTGSFISSDEGYHDDDFDSLIDDGNELPIESSSSFIHISNIKEDEQVRQLAAIKIQSVWRGYYYRKQHKPSTKNVLAGLVQINESIHRRNYNQLESRIETMEKKLQQETALRIAFEKAMEDMAVLMDHQQQVLNEKLEQEVIKRQQVTNQLQSLEVRLRHESKSKADIESMLSRVLDQFHDIKVQMKQQDENRLILERQLKQQPRSISRLSNQSTTSSNKKSIVNSTTRNQTKSINTTSNNRSIISTSKLSNNSSTKTTTRYQTKSINTTSNNRNTISTLKLSNNSSTKTTSSSLSSLSSNNIKRVIPKARKTVIKHTT